MKSTKQTIEFIVTFCLFLLVLHGFLFFLLGFVTVPLSGFEKILLSSLEVFTAWACAVRVSLLRLGDEE